MTFVSFYNINELGGNKLKSTVYLFRDLACLCIIKHLSESGKKSVKRKEFEEKFKKYFKVNLDFFDVLKLLEKLEYIEIESNIKITELGIEMANNFCPSIKEYIKIHKERIAQ